MLKKVTLYHFSPTGGTKKAGEMFCKALAEHVVTADLMKAEVRNAETEIVVFAAPVFAGRIPELTAARMQTVNGKGKKAITLAVYGTRAYDDALLEMNDIMEANGFEVVASAAVVAQHSIVSIVGPGRPDVKDEEELQNFAKRVLEKLDKAEVHKIEVPGNHPYRDGMKVAATPISIEACSKCGACAAICPTGAIQVTESGIETTLEKCMLCMACVAHCPAKGRILPPPMQAAMNEKLGTLKDIRRENEFFL